MIDLTAEDREAIRLILEAQREDGVERPLLALNVDIDGDGIVDAFGLDAFGQVILVPGVPLGATGYVSDGDDVREVPHA